MFTNIIGLIIISGLYVMANESSKGESSKGES